MFGRSTTGYAIFEIIAMLALVITLAVAVVPPLLQSLQERDIDRAHQVAESIGQAILAFRRDVGQWPVAGDGVYQRGWLVGNACLGGGRQGLPTLDARARKSDLRQASFRAIGTMTDHLIRNAAAAMDTLYPASPYPHVKPGWNGPYLESVPLDPWGNPYLVTFHETGGAGRIRLLPMHADGPVDSSVVVLSAGPDGLIQTAAEDVQCADDLTGDDIGYVISSWR